MKNSFRNTCPTVLLLFVIVLTYTLWYVFYIFDYPNLPIRVGRQFFPHVEKKLKCHDVFNRMHQSKPAAEWPPPRYPPKELENRFTQNGEMPIKKLYYFEQKYSGATARLNIWTLEHFNKLIRRHKRDLFKMGNYKLRYERYIRDALLKYTKKNQTYAVIGSEDPWVEAIIAANSAPREITTIEYGVIDSRIPYLKTAIPSEFAKNYSTASEVFDYVVSFSSMEHSGLGRYGDTLNPEGDIEAAEEVWCMLKPGGLFFVGLPYTEKSFIRWNADRNYGPERMRLFAANFEQVDYVGILWYGQGVFVLRKPLE